MKTVSILLLAGICLVLYGWKYSKPSTATVLPQASREAKPVAEIQALKPENVRRLPPVRQTAIQKIAGQIETLSERQKNIDHDLERAGFPGIFMDDRLAESEREQLLVKVQESTALGIEIAKLKFKQIDLTATENL